MKYYEKYTNLNLRIFDGEGGGAPAAEGTAGQSMPGSQTAEQQNIGEPVQPEGQTQPTREEAFDQFIKDNKDLFGAAVEKSLKGRMKGVNARLNQAEQKINSFTSLMDALSERYGTEDVGDLEKAVRADDSYLETEALERGLSVDQLKHIKGIERENATLKKKEAEFQQQKAVEETRNRLVAQSDECRNVFPNFDFGKEYDHPETGERFQNLINAGIDVTTAYKVIHQDELISGAIQYAAQSAQQKMLNDIQARGMRPTENGSSGNAAAVSSGTINPSQMTKAQREEISRRVLKGEKVVL